MPRPDFDFEIHPTPAEELELPTILPRILPEMERLAFLVGSWDITASSRFRDTWVQSTTHAEYRRILDGTMLEERVALSLAGTRLEVLAHWCWDRYREIYRMVRNDNLSSRSNVFEGEFFGDDTLVFTNLRSDTVHSGPEHRKHNRFSLLLGAPDRFRVLVEDSFDGGETWKTTNHYDATRHLS